MPSLGYGEILVVLVVALLVFGPEKMPELARSLGRAVHAFKSAWREGLSEDPPEKGPRP